MNPQDRYSWQRPQLRVEGAARARAINVAEHARGVGLSQLRIAETIGRSARTLRTWRQKKREHIDLAKPCGRTVVRSSLPERRALLASFQELGPHCGIAIYQSLHRTMARAEVESMIKRCRTVWQLRNPKKTSRLEWTRPGCVWAVDHSQVPGASLHERVAISCRDLASHEQLLWEPSRETTEITTEQIQHVCVEHGAPLVLKADGGPAFRSEEFHELLDQEGIELLPSPPYRPDYNGSCEAANQSMKKRTYQIANSNDRGDAWERWDLELARLQANHTARPWGIHGPIPHERWIRREAVSTGERAAFRAACDRFRHAVIAAKELSADDLKKEFVARWVQRVAVSRALVEHGLLKVQRRLIRPPIKTIRTA